jgi:intein/homing endonuclease
MTALEELKNNFMQKVIKFYNENKNMSITECAKTFNISRETLTTYLKKSQPENYLHKYNVNENFFEIIDTEEKAYWLGFLTADGNLFKDRNSIRLALAEKDKDHVYNFKKALNADHNVTIVPAGGYIGKNGERSMAASITIGNKKIHDDLVKLGFTSKKSCNEKPVVLPEELTRHYIRGIFDGDGWISFGPNHRDLGFGMGKEMLEYIKKIFEQYAKIKPTYDIKWFNSVWRYRISSKQEILKALEYMYKDSTIYLDRKYKKYLDFVEYCRLRPKNTEDLR